MLTRKIVVYTKDYELLSLSDNILEYKNKKSNKKNERL